MWMMPHSTARPFPDTMALATHDPYVALLGRLSTGRLQSPETPDNGEASGPSATKSGHSARVLVHPFIAAHSG